MTTGNLFELSASPAPGERRARDFYATPRRLALAIRSSGSGATFRSDVPSYATLLSQTQGQPELPFVGASPAESEDDLADCMCGGAE